MDTRLYPTPGVSLRLQYFKSVKFWIVEPVFFRRYIDNRSPLQLMTKEVQTWTPARCVFDTSRDAALHRRKI